MTRISVALVLTIIASNTVRCTPTTWDAVTATSRPKSSVSTLPASSTHAALSEELLDALKKFHSSSSSPGKDSPTPATTGTATPPIPPPTASNRISIMHFPAAPSSMSADQSSRSSTTDPGPLIPGQLHQLPFDLQMSDRGHNQIPEPPLSQAPLQSRAPLPVSVPSTIADAQSSPAHVTPPSDRSTDPASLKIEPIGLSPNSNQELIKLLTDLRMSPASLQESAAASGQNQILAPGQTAHHSSTNNLQLLSPGSPNSVQPSKVSRPILAPNQTPLDYLLSSSSPMYQINSINRRPPPPTDRPRPNLEFVKYLLTLPRYQQALNELIAAQSSTQT
ncbi:hypothetical protein AGLY_010708 [Aphis glycines]|uniref:Uncharacterized protein n=1 Tax=Aphis glycines TaxID=307491 RepID=A0A6G0TEB6_APHGL|nr:hypothetical protein AGLY_010708 [Aphis glycines]